MNALRLPSAILVSGVALVLAGCGAGAEESGPDPTSAAEIVPADAPVLVSLDSDLDSEQWENAEGLLDRFPGRERLIGQLREGFEDDGIDFERDVRPALGESVHFTWLDLEDEGDNLIGFTKPKDEEQFRRVLAQGDDPAVHTEIDGWTVFADDQPLLDRFRAAQQRAELADDEDFGEVVGGLPENALVKAYANTESIRTSFGDRLGQLESTLPGSAQLESVAAAITAESDGVKIEYEGYTEGQTGVRSFTPTFVDDVPADALAYIGFYGSQDGQLQRSLRELRANPVLSEAIRKLERDLGVRLDEVARLFSGEGALYARPGLPFPEVSLVLEVADAAAGLATVDRLAARASELAGRGSVPRPDPAAGVPGAKFVPVGPVSLRYAAFEQKLVLTTGPRGISSLREAGDKLAGSEEFQNATAQAGMQDRTTGFAYVDLEEAVPLLEGLAAAAGDEIPPDVRENLEPLRTLVAYGAENGKSFTAFLRVE